MTVTRATVRLNRISQVAEDACVNVWHFQHPTALNDARALELSDALDAFYSRIFDFYAGNMDRTVNSSSIQLAELTMNAPGPTDDSVSKILFEHLIPSIPYPVQAVGTNLPAEVACAMSFRGDITGLTEEGPGSTRPASRRRGRLFLGPFNAGANDTATALTEGRPKAAFRTAVLDSYEALNATLVAAAESWIHCVYSPATGNTFGVVQVSMDDAWDTIRRRGVAPTLREVRAIDWTP